ncbi:ABC transporter ATP-binding protein [Cupriavidus sp.]|uniref:ABC transporter ATP-binding protein n=1 Tax=Cupriavidus sp. TaxID=1873897 RepID=UPI0031E06930
MNTQPRSRPEPDQGNGNGKTDANGRRNGELVIDVHDLNKHFGDKHVVNNLTMQVARGEIFGFLGPNGSGKTTSIRMMCGLLTPDSGSGTCLGYDILKQAADIKRNVGYMTQRFSYWEDLSIRENLDFVARVYDMPNRKDVVARALEDLGLQSRAEQLAGSLSGGWKQRLALAACLLHEPQLLLLDEPTAGVDPKARRDFWEQLHQLAARGISVLVSTHYMDEAERCHKLAYIAYGTLLAQGTSDEVVASQHLSTWSVEGDNLAELSEQLQGKPGVDQTVAFGTALHVTGKDAGQLERTLRQYAGAHHRLLQTETSLEDVFIHMMGGAQDNMAAPPQNKAAHGRKDAP